MSNNHSILLVGGSDAGKTNYICRLWLAIKEEKSILRKAGLPDDLENLTIGCTELLKGKFALHTPQGVFERNSIPVRAMKASGEITSRLLIPDCSGEDWIKLMVNREWNSDWEDYITDSSSCLIFVRATSKEIYAPLDWISCEAFYGSHASTSTSTPVAFAGKRPTQVVLTEWLQFLQQAFEGRRYRPRIGIVVSAWDRMPPEQISEGADAFIRANFPLLDQFMETNQKTFEFSTFGVSVVGGDLKEDQGYVQHYFQHCPTDLGYVYHSVAGTLVKSPDITIPVAWAMGVI